MTQTPRRRTDPPLTLAQQEIWAYTTLYGPDQRYLVSGHVHLRGRIDPDLFERALRGVVADTETLRVRLDVDGPEPRQVVEACTGWPLHRGYFGDEPDPVAAALAHLRAAATGFDLNAAPLFDHHLLDVGAAGYLWGLRAHHIVFDGAASLALIRAVACAYTALLAGEPTPPFSDTVAGYVAEDLRYRASRRFSDDRAFWSGRLAGLPDAPMFAHPPVVAGSSGFVRHSGRPRVEDWRAFGCAAERFGVDWPALLAATTALLLHADSGARTVVLGLPVPAKRSRRALGMTSNVVGLRLEVDPAASIGALARAAQSELRTVLRHQHYRRFDLLADGTSPGGEHRITGPMLNILPIPSDIRFGDVHATPNPESTGHTEAFGIGVYAGDGPPRIEMDTAAARCDAASLASLHARFLSAMSEVASAADDTPAGRLTPARVVAASPSVHQDPTGATDRGIAEVFRSVARRFPERHALWYEGEHITYRELAVHAERFACHLAHQHGVRLGTPVGVRLPRTPDMVVAALALMRLGAICVPLHEQDPPDRVAWVLAHTGTELVLDDIALVRAVARSDGPVLTTPADSVPADAAAWLMFTSGSTGAPKGVLATHRAMVTRAIDRIAAGPEYARMLMHSPYAWDMVVWELWMPLLQGHTAVIATPDRLGAEDFRHVLRAGQVTAMLLAAGLFQVLVDDIPESLAELRTLSSAGDILAPDTVRAMRAAAPGISIVNIYGPVEATAYATAYSIPAGPLPSEAIPVGRAVDHTEVLVLDALLRPVPPGMVGEIYMTGAGLARGYHRMPGRTAAAFTANPFGAPGSRMYRTGDHGSWGADGLLRFLGRSDRQVKVNGIRVEPGEIEHAIRGMPGVTAAIVTAHRMAAGKTLIAHVVATEQIDTAAMRTRLARILPAYLLPAAIVQIPALPLTVNGKIDRKALTVPVSPAAHPPRTPRQQILAGLFSDAIGQQRVGIEDDFFRVGGNSLAAIRLAASASRTLGVVVALRDLLDAPTVAALERRIAGRGEDSTAGHGTAGREQGVIAYRESDGNPGPPDETIPLTPAQQRLWTVNYLSENEADYLMPAALDLIGPLDAAAVHAAVCDVVRRHEILRTTLPFATAGPVQRIAAFDPDAVDYREITDDEDLDRSLAQETARGFQLLTEAPIRVRLYRRAPDHHVLLVVLHHCAGDAESLALLLRDLRFAYLARAVGAAPAWPTPPVQFADYARWLREDAGDCADDRSAPARYWRDALAGLDYIPPLAVDHPRAGGGGYPAAAVPFTLDADAHAGLLDTARRCGATTYTVLHAALVCAFERLGAGPDLVIGTALSGRDRAELDTMLGCAADIVLIRTDRTAAPTARQLIGQVRDRVLEAHENKRYPFERSIAGHTGADRPLPQIVTTFFRDIAVTGTVGDLDVRLRESPPQRAEFEVLIQLREAIGTGGEPAGIHGEIRYAAPLWDRATITALAQCLHSAITSLHTEIDAPAA
ncbi:non-ribosomal peptide synthetase [Nocardia abscessus]|uniref:non-ribosomal peptide synthetase n=1 Tax=Nocardia abscessus TaxID=120957 RepID=UPI000317C520|nr:non-ribosomal peptide synthetase [Nocardia abscessus]MCC3331987.1 non-ribosomal peptide synthetase [Nocardia abscessus]